MAEQGVNVQQIIRTNKAMTTLAFVSLEGDGEREFAFYRKPGADMLLKEDEIDLEYLKSARIFHFGTISLTDEPVRSTTKFLVKKAKENGSLITFDPNIRLPLWNHDYDKLKEEYFEVLPDVDLLKLNIEEFLELHAEDTSSLDTEINLENLKLIAKSVFTQGPKYLIITDGSSGSYFISENEAFHVKTEK